MYLLYSTMLVFWGILLLPVFLYRAWRYHKYLPGLSQRLGDLPETLKFNGRKTIWFHSCSVGETLSLQPVVQHLRESFPEVRLVFSTITETGQKIAVERFSSEGGGNTFYFPVDLASVERRVLDWIKPAMVAIVDTEIWPNLLKEAHERRIPVVMINGRISAASFGRYRLFRAALRRVFRNYEILLMQSEEDAGRIRAIGAPEAKIVVTGNIKFDRDLAAQHENQALANQIDHAFGLSAAGQMLIVAGSTHPGEEEVLLEALTRIRNLAGLAETRMLLAPRHPERFEEVAELVRRRGFGICRRSAHPDERIEHTPVLLLDTLGELATAYRFATIAFIGGTLIPHGGHSIMEPACYAKAIVTGPSMENFRAIMQEFKTQGGIRQIGAGHTERERQVDELTSVFANLLQNRAEREALGQKAFAILEKNRGAARRTTDLLASLLKQ